MFRKIFQMMHKWAGVLSLEDLLSKFVAITILVRSGESKLVVESLDEIYKDDNLVQRWVEQAHGMLARVAEADSKTDQILKFRKEMLDVLELQIQSGHFIGDDISKEDKRIIAQRLNPEIDFDEYYSTSYYQYLYSDSSFVVLQAIARELEDLDETGWLPLYSDLYKSYIESSYKRFVCIEKDEEDVLNDYMFQVTDGRIGSMRDEILEGHCFDYDPEKIEEENKQREMEAEAKAEAAKRPKQQSIKQHQFDELVELLCERYEQFQHGKLFCLEDYSPSDPSKILKVDTALILTSLYECIESKHEAQNIIKRIMHQFCKTILADEFEDSELPEPEDIEIDDQIAFVDETIDKDGWLTDFTLVAIYYLYGLSHEDLSEEMIAKAAVSCIDDAWVVHASTKKVFGWDVETKGIFARLSESDDSEPEDVVEDEPKPKSVTINKKKEEAIYRYLCYRYQKAQNGNSYLIKKFKSYNAVEILKIDTSCVLKGLYDALESKDRAESILRNATYRLFDEYLSCDLGISSPDEIDISEQIRIINSFNDDDWLYSLPLYAIAYTHNIDIDELDEKAKKEVFSAEVIASVAIEISGVIGSINSIMEDNSGIFLKDIEVDIEEEKKYEEEECFEVSAPSKFADFMLDRILKFTIQDDYGQVPSEEKSKEFGISESDRKLAANECVLLKSVGVASCVRANFDEVYYLKFIARLLPPIIERLRRNGSARITNHEEAFNSYLGALSDNESHVLDFSDIYMQRVYQNSDVINNISFIGVTSQIAMKNMMAYFEATENAISLLKSGLSSNTIKQIRRNN